MWREKSVEVVNREMRNHFAIPDYAANQELISRPPLKSSYSHRRALSDPACDSESETTENVMGK